MVAPFIRAKIQKQPNCPSMDERIKLWDTLPSIYLKYSTVYVHISHHTAMSNKEWSSVIWDNMDGPGGNFAKWDKSDRERQMLHDLIYMWNLKKLLHINEMYSGSIPGSGRSLGEGNGNLLQYSCMENSTDREAWQATVLGIVKSWTQLSD